MRWQSTWPARRTSSTSTPSTSRRRINDMTGGDLKIEVLPAGAVVPAFGLIDAVSKGTLDGGHGVLVYHYGKQTALALWGSGPGYGMDANMLLSWHKYGGGKELLTKLYASIGPERRVLPLRADVHAAARVVQEADHQGRRLQGAEVPDRRDLDRRVHGPGCGGERAARRRDRPGAGPGAPRRRRVQQRDVRSHPRLRRRVQGLHAAELPPERRAATRSRSTRRSTTRCRTR